MPPKANPAKLNALQLKTLTLLQAIARIPGSAQAKGNGEVLITQFPHAHGDHFHLADARVDGKNPPGFFNEAVWNALSRKGLARSKSPHRTALTADGLGYDTGMADEILQRGTH